MRVKLIRKRWVSKFPVRSAPLLHLDSSSISCLLSKILQKYTVGINIPFKRFYIWKFLFTGFRNNSNRIKKKYFVHLIVNPFFIPFEFIHHSKYNSNEINSTLSHFSNRFLQILFKESLKHQGMELNFAHL